MEGGGEGLPLLEHETGEASAFTAANLMESVQRMRGLEAVGVPELCFLEFDGDLTDWLVAEGRATPYRGWACFHTTMYELELEGVRCGIVPRTIGGPYAVLVAEQLAAAGCRMTVGLTSAGRVQPELPLPCLVVATSAIRDEGTSFHYLPPGREVACATRPAMDGLLAEELGALGREVRRGKVWTTDAPYRETRGEIGKWAGEGVLAVEMQAASLFAFGAARGAAVAVIAMVSNAIDHEGEQFDTGTTGEGAGILAAAARAYRAWREGSEVA